MGLESQVVSNVITVVLVVLVTYILVLQSRINHHTNRKFKHVAEAIELLAKGLKKK